MMPDSLRRETALNDSVYGIDRTSDISYDMPKLGDKMKENHT